MRIKIDHIAKSEGHTGMEAKIIDGKVTQARIDVKEGARLIEGILKGRKIEEAPIITSRICGICPVVHNLTSIKAMEAALGLKIPEQIIILRKLMLYGQIIQSHILHIFMAISDYLLQSRGSRTSRKEGLEDAFDLRKIHPKRVKDIFKIREFANQIIEVIGGRATHPVASVIGGFTKAPDKKEFKKFLEKQGEILDAVLRVVELFKPILLHENFCVDLCKNPRKSASIARSRKTQMTTLINAESKYIGFSRRTEFIALKNKREYAIYEGDITSTQELSVLAKDYRCKLEKFRRPNHVRNYGKNRSLSYFRNSLDKSKDNLSVSNISNVVNLMKCNEKPYMVGALARINLSRDQLNKEAKKTFKKLFPESAFICTKDQHKSASVCYNPFYNLPAQMIEVVHFIEEIGKLILQCHLERSPVLFRKSAGQVKGFRSLSKIPCQGVGAIEAPRGTLYHSYKIDKDNRIIEAKIITPTAQFLLNLEKDLEIYIPTLKNLAPKDRRQRIEMLVRAYDLCISCAVH